MSWRLCSVCYDISEGIESTCRKCGSSVFVILPTLMCNGKTFVLKNMNVAIRSREIYEWFGIEFRIHAPLMRLSYGDNKKWYIRACEDCGGHSENKMKNKLKINGKVVSERGYYDVINSDDIIEFGELLIMVKF